MAKDPRLTNGTGYRTLALLVSSRRWAACSLLAVPLRLPNRLKPACECTTGWAMESGIRPTKDDLEESLLSLPAQDLRFLCAIFRLPRGGSKTDVVATL